MVSTCHLSSHSHHTYTYTPTISISFLSDSDKQHFIIRTPATSSSTELLTETIMSQSQSAADDSSSDGSGTGTGAGEIMLFGVRVKVDPMRKSVSMNNLSQYEQTPIDSSAVAVAAAADGYASADDAVRTQSNGGRERKRGIPWTEDEHKLFLLGLQKVGKGDWRGISRNFVKTRTPTQVASHAQKYFLRRSNINRRRRRSSLFDITTDSVAAMPTEEQQVKEDNKGKAVMQPSMASSQQIPLVNGGSKPLVHPIPIFPTPNPSTMMDLNLNRTYETDPLPISLNLSLSYDPNRSSSYQVISGFKNGDSMISVN
ncbi:putative transcription factor MYB-HB-like family [Helianthus annuus]|uniref:Putative transcription factor MYB1R1 n=2 Tax=Helianthus annuus TaxID=4232 RepID=A0A251U8M2_HELAN|nr:putative transcription factor MYB-related family [Helianthus annuus]KAJ0899379.1 putative transcription factor MYB-HB-like family [Helianthus annuus]KAJ0902961.1 putative transcription factor MYB-HB-like family [Helianthus annuus]